MKNATKVPAKQSTMFAIISTLFYSRINKRYNTFGERWINADMDFKMEDLKGKIELCIAEGFLTLAK